MFIVFLNYLILASTFTIAKITLFFAKPFFIIGFRMTMAGIILLIFQYLFNKQELTLKRDDWWLFFKASIFHVYLAFIPEFWSLQFLSSSKVTLIYSSTPFIAAILSYFIFSEKLSGLKALGMTIGLSGLVPIFLTQTDIREAGMSFLSISAPELVLMIAVFSATYAWFVVKTLLNKGYSFITINGVAMFVGGIFSLVTSFGIEGVKSSPVYNWSQFLFWVFLLIFASNVVFYNLNTWLMKHYSITFVTFAGFLCPIYGAFLGWFFLSEVITWHYFVALAFIITGLYIFYKDEMRIKA